MIMQKKTILLEGNLVWHVKVHLHYTLPVCSDDYDKTIWED